MVTFDQLRSVDLGSVDAVATDFEQLVQQWDLSSALATDVIAPLQGSGWSVLAGDDGKAIDSLDGQPIDGPQHDDFLRSLCSLAWSTKRRDPILTVLVASAPTSDGRSTVSVLGGGAARPISFGPDGIGLFGDGKNSVVDLVMPCEFQTSAAFGRSISPYMEVSVSGSSDIPTAPRSQRRQAYADIALKIAKAVVQRVPCESPVHLVDRAPTLPAG